eukprot:TRINITY_DN3041_c0_g2_i1.p2 TRINITY_DN3041_c0_g2~~TRINITY_DN3041_c0_g2_i1.p2  ORF type:complete len:125 (+),score=61.69 TRINITY_DN3041_c0_g2_i1:36-410(+)
MSDADKKRLDKYSEELQALQADVQTAQIARAQYEQKLQENKMVLDEMEKAGEGTQLYKLIGPTLLEQDAAEAKATVKKRIEFMTAEVKRAEKTVEEKTKTMETERTKAIALRDKIQAAVQQAKQ